MRFKSILGAFIFLLLASFIAFIVFIQTKSFGGLVTRIVSDLSRKQLDTEVKIKSFSISVFPPGLELNRVVVKKKISEQEKFEAELGRIGFYISLIEIEEKKLTFGELRVSDSVINYQFPKKNDELKEIDQKLIKKIFDLSNNAPVRIDTLLIENTRIIANHDLMDARRIKIFKKGDSFITRFHITNVKPSADSDLSIDEVWGDAEISRKKINLYRLKVQHDVHTFLLKGKFNDYYKLKDSQFNLLGETQIYLKNLNQELSIPEMVQIRNGIAKSSFNLDYKDAQLSASADLLLQDLSSNLFKAQEVRSLITLSDNKITIEKLNLINKEEKLKLTEAVIVADLNQKSYLTRPIKVSVENLHLNNALKFLGPKLQVLKGELNGLIKFTYRNKDLFFTPDNNFIVNNLGLVVGEAKKPFTVLMIKKAKLNDSQFAVINNEFQMSSSVELANSKLEVDGFVNKQRVQFNVPDAKIDLEDFGNISNLDIKGAGELTVRVAGPLDSTVINIKGKTKGFEVLGYRLGETEKNLSIELGSSNVVIKKMESKFGRTSLTGNGTINYKDQDIALGITSGETSFGDLSQILHPLFKDIQFLPEDLNFKAKVDADIFGKTRIDDLKIRSKVHFSDLLAYGETINSGSFSVSLFERLLSFKDLEANKSKGTILGDLQIGLKDKSLKLKYSWENLELSSFHLSKKLRLNFDSKISGIITGGGTTDNYMLKLESTAFNTESPTYKFEDSFVAMNIMPARISGKMILLGETIASNFNLALKPGLASDLLIRVRTGIIKPFLVALFGQHLEAEEFSGKIAFDLNTKFQDGFNQLDMTGHLKQLVFNHSSFNVNYSSQSPQLMVKNSIIQKWNMDINQPDFKVVTKGEGVFGKKVNLRHEYNFNSKILEVLLDPILSSDGIIKNIVNIEGDGTDFDFRATSQSDDLDLTISTFPIPVNDLKYNIGFANGRLTISKLTTALDTGSVEVLGDIYFDADQPDVNLKFMFDKAEIPILGKSIVNLSGEGVILGNNLPYTLSGDLLINKAQIVNELNEFSSKSAAFSQIRFLPKNQESPLGKLLALNVNIKSENPIRVTNSLMDVALIGEVRITGNPARLRGEGRLQTPANSSRIFFKNNEYMITSADINFTPKKELSNPDFDVQALTLISNYKVYPKAYGDLERFNFELTSDPALPRNSILSLIAFGYTDEIQSALRPEDQQNLNQVGVGSFVFDRFKISDILNKQFGLQVNLGTVIEQSGTDSLLTGRTQEGQSGQGGGSIGRTRSATKIELKKRLDEALTLSVSSTMGGSIGQRQSMNLNYGLSQKIQVEGVYELRTNEEGQEDVIDNSIGGDLKFRWTFK